MRALVLALLLAAAPVLAGCTQAPAAQPEDPVDPASDGGAPTPPSATPTPTSPTPDGKPNGNGSASGGSSSGATSGNATSPPAGDHQATPPTGPAIEWPPLDKATIRPGVQVVSAGSQCTSNFVFTSPDNATIYLGAAAHCFGDNAQIGQVIDVGPGIVQGVLAYSSWLVTGYKSVDSAVGDSGECSVEKDANVCDKNDFALIMLPPEARALTHPAVRHFGGPTALAPSGDATAGSKVMSYGNSGLRAQTEPTSWKEGIVVDKASAWSTEVYTATPGVPGDSGSGMMLADGRAFGVLVTVYYTPVPGMNGVTSLDLALEYAREKGGFDARLATWALLDPGVVPLT